MGLDWFPNVPNTYREMNTEAKTRYIADEIINYFQLSWGIELQVSLGIICLTIFVNVFLLFAIVITGNIKKSQSSLEVARGMAESLMLLSIAVQASKNMYNTTDAQKAIPGFVSFWFFCLGSVNLGLIKSFIRIWRLTDKSSFSRLQWLIIMVVIAAFTIVTFGVLCVLYMTNILAFVILVCFLYYIPFITMWIFDGLRFCHLCYKNKPKNDRAELEELAMAAENNTSAHETVQQTRQSEKLENDRAEMEELAKPPDNKTSTHVQTVQQTRQSVKPKNERAELEELAKAVDNETSTHEQTEHQTKHLEKLENDRAEMEEPAKPDDNKTSTHVQAVQQTRQSEKPKNDRAEMDPEELAKALDNKTSTHVQTVYQTRQLENPKNDSRNGGACEASIHQHTCRQYNIVDRPVFGRGTVFPDVRILSHCSVCCSDFSNRKNSLGIL